MKPIKITLLLSIGTALEYYDLVIYSLLANFISQQFFPATSRTAAIFATFGLLASGNLIRPLGGVIIGFYGDRLGRKKVFSNTLNWMALATLVMGLVPTFSSWGIWSTIVFCLCRLIQNISFGAESPGALTILSEYINKKHQGLYFGILASSMGIGVSLGSLIIWLLTKFLSPETMLAWGFRIPFLFGGTLSLMGFYIRKHLPETPKFIDSQKIEPKITPLLAKKYLKPAIVATGILILSASFSSFKLVLPLFLREFYHYELTDIYKTMTLGYAVATIILKPIFGFLADYVGKKRLILISSFTMFMGSHPIFSLLATGKIIALYLFTLFSQLITSCIAASCFALLPKTFPTNVRYTGTSLSYNLAHIVASLIPIVATYVYNVLKNPNYLILVFMGLAMISAYSTLVFNSVMNNIKQ